MVVVDADSQPDYASPKGLLTRLPFDWTFSYGLLIYVFGALQSSCGSFSEIACWPNLDRNICVAVLTYTFACQHAL